MKKVVTNYAFCIMHFALTKRLLTIMTIMLVGMSAMAQPKARREAAAKKKAQASTQMTKRAQLMFPTAIDMPEEVSWRRDIYREIDLNNDVNSGLYYPVEPVGHQLNLFTYIFKLALNGYIPVYEYRLDGNELFNDSAKVKMKTILDNYHIFYEENKGKIRVDNSDIPSAEVKLYYLKESSYYDEANSTLHRQVVALCPVMTRDDDFGGEPSKYPLFWVKYSDLKPFLNRQTVSTSSLNNAATVSMEDYFTLNMYDGKIYKTGNLLGKTLAQYCPTDSALAKEQKRIEQELTDIKKTVYGDQAKRDSLDSIAKLNPKDLKAAKKSKKSNSRRSGSSTKVKKAKSSSSSSSGSAARVTVRRQRH